MRDRRFLIIGVLIIAGLCLTLFYSGWAALVAVTKRDPNPFDKFDATPRVEAVKVCTYFDGFSLHSTEVVGGSCPRFQRASGL